MTWPITWPAAANVQGLDPAVKTLAELYARNTLEYLTLRRVGGNPVTILPATSARVSGYWMGGNDVFPLGNFYPGVYPSAQDLTIDRYVTVTEAIELPGPVGTIVSVTVDNKVLPATAYRVENGVHLVRTDGGQWPRVHNDSFAVTYYNSTPVDAMGSHAAGIMAWEWSKFLTGSKCRLPTSVTSVTRQGMNYQVAHGMFPDGMTGLPEVDAYIMLLNPRGLKSRPMVYSPDLPGHRQVR